MKKFIVTTEVNYDEFIVKLDVEAETCNEIDSHTISINGAIIKFPEYVSVMENDVQ